MDKITQKLKADLVDKDAWNYGNCRERLIALAEKLNHFELEKDSPLDMKLKTSKYLFFKCLEWTNYNRDLLERPGNPLGYNGRSVE